VNIVIVEDDESLVLGYKQGLKDLEAEVHVAKTGAEPVSSLTICARS